MRFGERIAVKDWSRTSEEGLHEGSELHDCVARISDTATNQHVEASPQDRNLGEEFALSHTGAAFENDDCSDARQETIKVRSDDRQLGVPAANTRRIGTGARWLAIHIHAVIAR